MFCVIDKHRDLMVIFLHFFYTVKNTFINVKLNRFSHLESISLDLGQSYANVNSVSVQ